MPSPHLYLRVRTPRRALGPSLGCAGSRVYPPILFPASLRRSGLHPSRGKKTSVKISYSDLPQGVISLDPLPAEDDAPSYPTVLQQARTNMNKFENCVVLTRVGGFYELYFEHAAKYGPLLGLKVAQKKTNAGPVFMAGFPFFQLDRYLKILVHEHSSYVAIAEEYPNDLSKQVKAGGLMHDRRVARVITPGTLIDENFLDPCSNSYILAIHIDELSSADDATKDAASTPQDAIRVGLAWLDLSTGHFFTQLTNMAVLPSVLARIGPRETVLDQKFKTFKDHPLFPLLAEGHHFITYSTAAELKQVSDWTPMLESSVPSRSIKSFSPEEVTAGSSLLQYVETRLQGSNMKLQPPIRQLDLMSIDRNTMRALEIKTTTMGDSIVGSLLHTVRRTVTKGGARLLENWLSSPSTSLCVINNRLDLVDYMLNDENRRQQIIALLRRCHDTHRLLQKFAFGRGDADDLLALASTIRVTQELLVILKECAQEQECIHSMALRIKLSGPKALASRIGDTIDEEGVVQQHRLEEGAAGELQALAEAIVVAEGSQEDSFLIPKSTARKKKPTSIREYYSTDNEAWIMKTGASPTLKKLHKELAKLKLEKSELEEDLCTKLGATSLTLRFSPGLGHICHVKGKNIDIDRLKLKSVSTNKSSCSFHHPKWTNLGQKMDQCMCHLRAEEQRVFLSLRELVISNIVKLRRNAAVIHEIDVACSFATLAHEKSWSRPILNMGTRHKVIAGRHPTVESGLECQGRGFVTNDCFVGESYRTWLITGPNMGGKSTFLRQNALITILAQTGSYVPASFAEIGIADQIFSRVGSADNLFKDQSTFMVEMLETGQILKQATERSFVIMDEIGRGTTPEDGEAVAWACLWHLNCVNKCRTLFATHFHGLCDKVNEKQLEGTGLWCTDVEESGNDENGATFRYVHRVREGVNKMSHALKVARLAGLPNIAIDEAKKFLNK
ncbi:MutS 1 [Podosphaera aphanis]|nr:MutS 1 [Podosphaera aphanis]